MYLDSLICLARQLYYVLVPIVGLVFGGWRAAATLSDCTNLDEMNVNLANSREANDVCFGL